MMAPPPPPPPPPPPTLPHDPHSLEANGRYQTKPDSPFLMVLLNIVNALTQLLLGAVAFSAFSFASILNMSSPFTQHIYLCVIGYVILMSQAILSFNTHAGWAYSLKYPQKRAIHWIMQVVGSLLAITGSVIRIQDMDSNFQTAHGITGLIAMLLTSMSLVGGLINLIFPTQMRALFFKILHICLGIVTMSTAFICLCFGFNDMYRFIFGDINANLSIAVTVFAMLGIYISASAKIVRRINE